MELTDMDYEGYGVYDSGNHYGHVGGFGQVLGLPAGLLGAGAEKFFTKDGPLTVLKPGGSEIARGVLDQTTLSVTSQTADTIEGQAVFVAGTLGSGWASDYISKGYVVMVEIATIESASPRVCITKNPEVVYTRSNVGGGYVIVAGAPGVIAAARAFRVEPAECPAGMTMTPTGCKLIPGGVTDKEIEKAEARLPGWVIPVAVGAGVLVIAALMMSQKRGRR